MGPRFISGSGGDGYNDHGLLAGLSDDDHLQYLITSAIRLADAPTSGINKTGPTSGDVFTLVNAGSGAALYIQQTGTTSDADAAVDIVNTGNVGRGLSVFTETPDPSLPLAQFSALADTFDEPILLITHADPRGLAIDVRGDGYLSGILDGPMALTFTGMGENPIELGNTGIYVESDVFYFVDSNGEKHTFSLDEKVKVSINDTTTDYLINKLVAGPNVTISELFDGSDESIMISSTVSGAGVASDGYFPFIEVDELEMGGAGSGVVPNTIDEEVATSITRIGYNNFAIGDGTLEIKGLTLRSTIDSELAPSITYTVIKDAELIDDDVPNTVLSGGTLIFEDEPTTEVETFIGGNRKDGEIQFTTGAIDFDSSKFTSVDSNPDGYFFFIFAGDHTLDTKTIVVNRLTVGSRILNILFTYPTCSFTGLPQTAVRAGQTFPVTVLTAVDGYASAISVTADAGDAIQSQVALTEGAPGVWTGTVTARTGQPNGFADINATASDIFANSVTNSTTDTGDPLVLFDNDFPVIETFEEGTDLIYPDGQTCLAYGEDVDAYMTASDFTEILYSSPTGRFTIPDPTVYAENKKITWDVGVTGIEENAGCGALTTSNYRIRVRKGSNCSETTRDLQVRLDDTPPRITSIRWRRNNSGQYNLTSPTLCNGTHGIRFIFDDCLLEIPEITIRDPNKGVLSVLSGATPGTTFTATLTVDNPPDTNGCTEFVLNTAINCSHKLPFAVDPIDNDDEGFCIDVVPPDIHSVEIDVDLIDGYWNDGYDGYNVMDDDADNQDNTDQACELDFSSGVQRITSNDILTRHGESVYVTVRMNAPIETGDTCLFDASPWGASVSLSIPQYDDYLYQGQFATALGSTRNDDQGRAIGRASKFHETGEFATVTDLGECNDTAYNFDVLSANGIDDVASTIPFTTDGTVGAEFDVSTDSFRAFIIGRTIKIEDDNSTATYRTVTDANNGTISCDGGSLAGFTVAQNARAVPLSVSDAEIAAWDVNNGLVAYINDGAFTHLTLIDFANPEAFSQHLTNEQLTQNNAGTVDLDLFRANFWGSKISVPNTGGGSEANPTGALNSKYVWRSKRIRLTTNPTGVQGTNLRFMVFGFSAGTTYRNVNISATSDWDQNANKFNLGNNDSQIEVRICTDDPFASAPPYTKANWYETREFEVSPQAGFKFGKSKDINLVFDPPSTDIIDKDIYIEITLITNGSGKAPQIDMIGMSYLT